MAYNPSRWCAWKPRWQPCFPGCVRACVVSGARRGGWSLNLCAMGHTSFVQAASESLNTEVWEAWDHSGSHVPHRQEGSVWLRRGQRHAGQPAVWVCVWGRESEWECGCLHEFVGDCLMCPHVLGVWKLKAEALYNSHTALITFLRLKLTNWTSKASLMSHYNRQILSGSTFL